MEKEQIEELACLHNDVQSLLKDMQLVKDAILGLVAKMEQAQSERIIRPSNGRG